MVRPVQQNSTHMITGGAHEDRDTLIGYLAISWNGVLYYSHMLVYI